MPTSSTNTPSPSSSAKRIGPRPRSSAKAVIAGLTVNLTDARSGPGVTEYWGPGVTGFVSMSEARFVDGRWFRGGCPCQRRFLWMDGGFRGGCPCQRRFSWMGGGFRGGCPCQRPVSWMGGGFRGECPCQRRFLWMGGGFRGGCPCQRRFSWRVSIDARSGPGETNRPCAFGTPFDIKGVAA